MRLRDTSFEKNNNWRGGKTTTKHGYILIRVGIGHPMADCRGYAYEHRVVASKKIGRVLLPTEKVHHINGDRSNNMPDNLDVVASNAEHFIKHRKTTGRRMPKEENPIISCQCGCGGTFLKYDHSGRPRRYISGHNGRKEDAKN